MIRGELARARSSRHNLVSPRRTTVGSIVSVAGFNERIQHVNRIKGLLASVTVRMTG